MTTWQIVSFVMAILLASMLAAGWKPYCRWMQKRRTEEAIRRFRLERERLEAQFFDMASRLGVPRGLRWLECDWQPSVAYARDLRSGLLTAFVGVNIRFEAVEGGDMEEVQAVGMVRDAAALFHHGPRGWGTGGKALFNMNPEDAVARLQGQFSPPIVPAQLSEFPTVERK